MSDATGQRLTLDETSLSPECLTVKDTHGVAFVQLDVWAPRPQVGQVAGRRPMVAILDTGVGDHEWFRANGAGDPVCTDATSLGWFNPGVGADRRRHGTFVAGLIRQASPDARILSVELGQDEYGKPVAGEILRGLQWLRELPSTPGAPKVDMLCLAVGYRQNTPDDERYTAEIDEIIRALGAQGVLVVAAAGNRKTGEADYVYPAALAGGADPRTPLPIVAVGATNADGTWADFSITGDWVKRKWIGRNVFSTFPVLAGQPEKDDSDLDLLADNPSSSAFTSGFAVGSGTSFAAAGFAGHVAQVMLERAGSTGIQDAGPEEAIARASGALADAGGFV
jgi:subtilisin family serine protease